MFLLILSMIIVISFSWFCAMTEAALFVVPVNRVHTLVDKKVKNAQSLLKLKESMEKPISSIVILNNFTNIAGSIIVNKVAENALNVNWVIALFPAILTFLIIIFGEIIPKTVGNRYSEQLSLALAKPILALTFILTPLVYSVQILTRPFSGNKKSVNVSVDEIKVLTKLGVKVGIFKPQEANIVGNAFTLKDTIVDHVMTPRTHMFAFDGEKTIGELKEEILNSRFSRIPVFIGHLDHIIGVLYKNTALYELCMGNDTNLIKDYVNKTIFVPETKTIGKLLQEFKKLRIHQAMVVDEYGGIAGLVTLEDILEEIVGEIIDESDLITEDIKLVNENEAIILGYSLVEDINTALNIELENHRTISKLILDKIKRFPKKGEIIVIDDIQFMIIEATSKTIDKIKVSVINRNKEEENEN